MFESEASSPRLRLSAAPSANACSCLLRWLFGGWRSKTEHAEHKNSDRDFAASAPGIGTPSRSPKRLLGLVKSSTLEKRLSSTFIQIGGVQPCRRLQMDRVLAQGSHQESQSCSCLSKAAGVPLTSDSTPAFGCVQRSGFR